MPGIEPVPSVVVLAGVLGTLNPFHAADRHDVRAWGRNGAACRVDAQSASSNSHVGAMLWKCAISLCISVAD